jgi:LuxR family maltose regulon positive regulatory protein
MPSSAASGVVHPEPEAAEADESLLISKITVPVLPAWAVARDRVDALIAEGVRRPLTVVTGPPGAGKTIAIASWAAAAPGSRPVAWISVDRYDNRPETFWRHLAEALRRVGVAATGTGQICADGESARRSFLSGLASALAGLDPPVVLVLDDIHVLTKSRPLEDLAYVLQNAGQGLRLVVASRMDPLLPLHRFRLAGELTEVRARDLAFTTAEAGQLMAQHGIALSRDAVQTLTGRTEGWAAGLRLAALSMQDHPDPDQFARQFGAEDSAVVGYLVNEVLDAQPPPARALLLKTSILERVNDDLAAALTGDQQAAGTLPGLAAASGFVQPIGHGWYRYHSLLAEVLRLKLRREARCDVMDLHRRATAWLRRNGRLAEAVGQASAGADGELAARTVVDELAVGRLLEPGAFETLADEVRHMPAAQATGRAPALLARAAVELRDARPGTAEALLRTAESLLEARPAADEIPSRLAAAEIRLALARQRGDLDLALSAAAEGEVLLGTLPDDLAARHPEARAHVLAHRGAVDLWRGHFDSAATCLDAAAAASGTVGEHAEIAGRRALLEAVQGRPSHAAELVTQAAVLANGRAGSSRPQPYTETALAWADLERDRLDDSRRRLAKAQDALRACPDRLLAALASLVAARHAVATGRPRAAPELITQARNGWSPPPWLEHRLALGEAHALAATGDATAALNAARRAEPGSAPEAAIARARAWLAAGDLHAAGESLAAAPAIGCREAEDHLRVEACLIEAALRYRADDHAAGRAALHRALRLAEPEQLRLPFRLERTWLEPVMLHQPGLAQAFSRLFTPEDMPGRAAPAPAVLSQRAPSASSAGPGSPVVIEPLSQREREVLQHASGMLSTAEIAGELYLSVNTVKSHLRSIFRKLGATRRGEAVRRARDLQLL